MKLDSLTNNELLKLAEHQNQFNEYINEEWIKRYKMSFPYQLLDDGQKVYNAILDISFSLDEVDKMVAKQARESKGK